MKSKDILDPFKLAPRLMRGGLYFWFSWKKVFFWNTLVSSCSCWFNHFCRQNVASCIYAVFLKQKLEFFPSARLFNARIFARNLQKCRHYFWQIRHYLWKLNLSSTLMFKLMDTLFFKLLCRTPEPVVFSGLGKAGMSCCF